MSFCYTIAGLLPYCLRCNKSMRAVLRACMHMRMSAHVMHVVRQPTCRLCRFVTDTSSSSPPMTRRIGDFVRADRRIAVVPILDTLTANISAQRSCLGGRNSISYVTHFCYRTRAVRFPAQTVTVPLQGTTTRCCCRRQVISATQMDTCSLFCCSSPSQTSASNSSPLRCANKLHCALFVFTQLQTGMKSCRPP